MMCRGILALLLLIIPGCIPATSTVDSTEPQQITKASLSVTSAFDYSKSSFPETVLEELRILEMVYNNAKVLGLCAEDGRVPNSSNSPPDSRAYAMGTQYLIQIACSADATEEHSGNDKPYHFLLFGANKGIRIDGGIRVLPLRLDVIMYCDKVAARNQFLTSTSLPSFDPEQKTITLGAESSPFNQCPDKSVYQLANEQLKLVDYEYARAY